MSEYDEIVRRWSKQFRVIPPKIKMEPIAKMIHRTRRTPRAIIRETVVKGGQYFPATKTIVLDPKWGSRDVLRHEFAHHLQFELGEHTRIGRFLGRGKKAGLEANIRRWLPLLE